MKNQETMTNQDQKSFSNKVTLSTCVRPSRWIRGMITPTFMLVQTLRHLSSPLIPNLSRKSLNPTNANTTLKFGEGLLPESLF